MQQHFLEQLHVFGALGGQLFALGASLFSACYLWQDRALRTKRWRWLLRPLPALDRLSTLLKASLYIGFPLLTVALVSGFVHITSHWDTPSVPLAKITWAISVWLWYLVILLGNLIFRWHIKQVAQLSLLGAFLLATMFFGLVFWHAGGTT